jgi:uncharacterized protein YuzE
MSHYVPEDDIAAIEFDGFTRGGIFGEEFEWGLILRDRESKAVVGVEIWEASKRLPAELLDALPKTPGDVLVFDSGAIKSRQTAG